jgi:hypothetical protein
MATRNGASGSGLLRDSSIDATTLESSFPKEMGFGIAMIPYGQIETNAFLRSAIDFL